MLVGGTGRDILIGGDDEDRLVGGDDSDVLIGGSTNRNHDDAALLAILADWASDDSYDERVNSLQDTLSVTDDEEEDQLIDGGNNDLFFAGLGDM